MSKLMNILHPALAGALGGAAAWVFILALSSSTSGGLLVELMLGALTGFCIGGFIWSRESVTGRQFSAALKKAALGAAAGFLGGAAGAIAGTTLFIAMGRFIVESGGLPPSLGIALAVSLGWSLLGAAVGASGGLMIRSRERTLYGLAGGSLGGFLGGLLFFAISSTSNWSVLVGLSLLGMCIGAFISLVEEAFVSARVKVIKGRHVGREFPLLKEKSVIGRDDRSDVCLSGAEGVGMEHAVIKRMKGRFSIESNRQGTGVYVNHALTDHSKLADGDVIRVGSVLLMFNAAKKAASLAAITLLAVVSFLNGGASWAGEATQARITQFDVSSFPAVTAYVSVLDREGKPLRGLTKADVTVTENGKPVTLRDMSMSGSTGKREPLALAIVVDRSGSMAGAKITHARESVLRFISLMEKGDRASLYAFSDDVSEVQSLSGDQEKLKSSVRTIAPGGNTALYDAIARGVDSVNGLSGRKAVVVLSDGIANRGTLSIDQAIEGAVKSYVSVYVIGLGEDVRAARLERIANETGGSYFFTPSSEGLASIYEAISRRIRNEYVLRFTTERRGEYLRNVSVTLRPGLIAKRTYFQPRSSLFGAGSKPAGWAYVVPFLSIIGLLAVSLRALERFHRTGHLSVVAGKASKKELDIISAVTIGRDERNTLGLFRDDNVEQTHAEVRKDNGRYVVQDRSTASGTYVNQKKIAGVQALTDGDIISIGAARIVFSQGSRPACPACGGAMRNHAKFCPKCGVRTTEGEKVKM
ncbi:MAG: hypothetical protein A2X56_01405 [Nitrospirae bacterium GWC2_57_13]|jgi:VWFA-related protein|nr:MAG: hypothetical protein A2X56_01405 [Nitrospirae bacterium GWC2_57_13]